MCNAYFGAKFGFDTAEKPVSSPAQSENGPFKVCKEKPTVRIEVKKTEVTLKTSGEIHDGTGRAADKAVLAGMGLAMTASIVPIRAAARRLSAAAGAKKKQILGQSRT